jgi:excisionase family DNA binding protein
MRPHQERQAFSPDEVAQRNGVGRSLVFQEIKEGRLKAQKAGRRTIITRENERDWLERLPAASAERVA